MDAVTAVPTPVNETVRGYAPGSPERGSLEAKLKEFNAAGAIDLTCTIGGEQRLGGGAPIQVVQPHKHAHVLGTLGNATEADGKAAVDAALAAAPAWRSLSFDDRAAIFLKAADLLAGPWRDTLNAATMLGQSKTVQQAEIDAACELIDFLRFNVAFARNIVSDQPISSPGIWNRVDYRPLEGFVYAITPFNFTAIAGNLPTAPALMGNTVVWKPSPTQQFAAHWTMRLLRGRGPPGRRDQPRHRRRHRRQQGRADPSGPGRHPLHRIDQDLPEPVVDGRRQHRVVQDLSAAGRRDRRQGLHPGAPVGRPRGTEDRDGSRRLRVPGAEVLRRQPLVRRPQRLEPDPRRHRGRDRLPHHGRRHATCRTSSAR